MAGFLDLLSGMSEGGIVGHAKAAMDAQIAMAQRLEEIYAGFALIGQNMEAIGRRLAAIDTATALIGAEVIRLSARLGLLEIQVAEFVHASPPLNGVSNHVGTESERPDC